MRRHAATHRDIGACWMMSRSSWWRGWPRGVPSAKRAGQRTPSRRLALPARFLVDSVRLDRYLKVAPKYVHVPVLLLLAERDRILDNARTRQYVEEFATTDKTIIEYPDAHHTLEFEPEPERFIKDVTDWLERHARKG